MEFVQPIRSREKIAEIKELSKEEVVLATTKNALKLFNIKR